MTRASTHPSQASPASQASWWRTTWPLDGRDFVRLGIWLGIVIAVGVAVGDVLTNWSLLDDVVDLDRRMAENLADGRTDTRTDLAHWGAFIANTPVKIALSLIVAGLLTWRYRRWHEALMVGLPLIFEACAFIVISFIVGRPRPPVERLLDSPVDTSFPSGHVAAATVYAAFAVIAFWHTRSVLGRTAVVVVVIASPLVVGWARMYQGMHFLTDVTAGIVLGLVSVAIVLSILGPPPRDDDDGVRWHERTDDRPDEGSAEAPPQVGPVLRRSRSWRSAV
jgi:membrane-associated phospholipid phosphatase